MMSDELGMRNKGMISFIFIIQLSTFIIVLFLPFFFPSTLFSQEIPSEEEWKHWQSLYNQRRAEEELDPVRKKAWLQKSLAIKELEVTAVNSLQPETPVSGYRGFEIERCITCHDGIEETGRSHPLNFGCTVCHGGDPESVVKSEAHSSLLSGPGGGKNPSDLRVSENTCGLKYCHSGHEQSDRNHILRVRKSIMGTNAGEISALRYLWGAQENKEALFGSFGIMEKDGHIPWSRGGLPRLDTIPYFSKKDVGDPDIKFSGRIADSRWRKSCDGCHLWSEGVAKKGAYRSSGCGACHVPYNENGFYEGDDPTIPRDESGHMKFHKIRSSASDDRCLTCHVEMAPLGKFKGISPKADIHRRRGMACVDCHTQWDIMGDGDIYSKEIEQVEIRCETCHGTADSPPVTAEITDPDDRVVRMGRANPHLENKVGDKMVVSALGNKLVNVKAVNEEIVLVGKLDGKERKIPLLKNNPEPHSIPGHEGKLECAACHSAWSLEIDYGNGIYDQRKFSRDKLLPEYEATRGFWDTKDPVVRAIPPHLVVGPRGKATTAMRRMGFFLTALDHAGKPIAALNERGNRVGYYKNWSFTEPEGFSSGFIIEGKTIHSINREARSCASCHLNPSALSLGIGDVKFGKNLSGRKDEMSLIPHMEKSGSPVNFPAGVKGTLNGGQVSGDHQPGTRAFTRREINRVLKVGVCVVCHDSFHDVIYRNMGKSYAVFKTADHRKKINQMKPGAN